MQRYASLILGEIGGPALPQIAELLQSPDEKVHVEAASGLLQMAATTVDVVPVAMAALKNSNTVVRRCAAAGVVKSVSHAESEIPRLNHALDDSDRYVCEYAPEALGQLGPAAVPELAAKLRQGQSYAAVALGRIGPAARGEIPLLIDTLRSRDSRAQEHAARGLLGIGAEAIPGCHACSSRWRRAGNTTRLRVRCRSNAGSLRRSGHSRPGCGSSRRGSRDPIARDLGTVNCNYQLERDVGPRGTRLAFTGAALSLGRRPRTLIDAVVRRRVERATFQRGDTDGDGTVDLIDAVRLSEIVVGLAPPAFDCDPLLDANDDGQVDLSDAVTIFEQAVRGAVRHSPSRSLSAARTRRSTSSCASRRTAGRLSGTA